MPDTILDIALKNNTLFLDLYYFYRNQRITEQEKKNKTTEVLQKINQDTKEIERIAKETVKPIKEKGEKLLVLQGDTITFYAYMMEFDETKKSIYRAKLDTIRAKVIAAEAVYFVAFTPGEIESLKRSRENLEKVIQTMDDLTKVANGIVEGLKLLITAASIII